MDNEGIKIEYTLSKEDTYSVLKKIKPFKTDKNKYLYTVIFGVCCIANIIGFILKRDNPITLFIAVVSALMIAAVWFLPENEMKKRAERSGSDKLLKAEFFADSILMGENEEDSWTVDLKNSHYRIEEDYLIVFAPNGYIAAFPKKDIDDETYVKITSIVTSAAAKK